MVSNALIYSLRFADKLVLPKLIMENISKLRVVPAAYNKPSRISKPRFTSKTRESDNWRTKILVDMVRKIREVEDPNYDEIFGILNIIAPPTLNTLSTKALEILQTRDEQFRLRVTTLLFDKAIKGSAYAGIMAQLAAILNAKIPEVSEDLETHITMFTSLYDMSETLTFPKIEDAEFEDKVILWSKQKDIRKGYARFLTHLFSLELISGKSLQESMQKIIGDLQNTIIQPKSEQTEENTTQFADFLYEIAKLLKPQAVELRGLISSSLEEILNRPRSELPSLNMRSRFKIEDTIKCVKVI